MKKLLVFLICMTLCLSILSGCNTKKPPEEEASVSLEEGMAGLAQFFKDENFVPGLSQSDLKKQMEKYSYEGEKITELLPGEHGDGLFGGGYSAIGSLFGFVNNYSRSKDAPEANYENSFYSLVPLDGLTMPLEISFGDSLTTVCEKTGLSEDWREGLVPGEKKTLYENGQITVTLLHNEQITESSYVLYDSNYSYILKYDKTYESTRVNGSPVTVTETVKFGFVGEGEPLVYFYVSVNENYEV